LTNENKNLNDELTSTKNKLEDNELKYNQLENELKNKSENVIKSLNDKIGWWMMLLDWLLIKYLIHNILLNVLMEMGIINLNIN